MFPHATAGLSPFTAVARGVLVEAMLPMRKMRLPGLEMAWREFGDPAGRLLFFFHGWPGSGAQAVILDAAARRYGFRGIAMDRPGIGASPLIPGRRLVDWPRWMVAFAEQLGQPRFSVLGVSGGGPYALACAALCPQVLDAVSVVCGAPPIAELSDHVRLHRGYQELLKLFHARPEAVRAGFRWTQPVMRWPDAREFFRPTRILLPRPDAEALEDPRQFAAVFDCQRDAFTSVDGLFADAAIYAQPWGFALESIRLPVQFWHGSEDANFHYSLAHDVAARVPQGSLRVIENEGHFSLPIRHADAIVAAMANVC